MRTGSISKARPEHRHFNPPPDPRGTTRTRHCRHGKRVRNGDAAAGGPPSTDGRPTARAGCLTHTAELSRRAGHRPSPPPAPKVHHQGESATRPTRDGVYDGSIAGHLPGNINSRPSDARGTKRPRSGAVAIVRLSPSRTGGPGARRARPGSEGPPGSRDPRRASRRADPT